MNNIIAVECASSGVNYIQDIIDRNYNPIALQLKLGTSEEEQFYQEVIEDSLKLIDADFELINEKETYEETLEMVREYNPIAIIAASEKGVILATKLANDLNLPCNPIENIDALTFKDKMQEKIAEKGLRHIRGRRVKSVEEAIEFYDEANLSEVVVKPVYSAGTVGVKLCLNKQEMIDAIELVCNEVNLYGDDINEVVVQERIKGNEYVINTVACDGDYRVTTMWKYEKIKTPEGNYIYDYMEVLDKLGVGEADIVEYAYAVNRALGIKYGPVHGEFMVDDEGPVLIEVNCRPMGGTMKPEYLDRISGQHETDSALDSYINPNKFHYQKIQKYQTYEHGIIKWFIVPRDIIAKSNPIKYISSRLESHYKTEPEIIDNTLFIKTKDFETTGGSVFLVNEDIYTIQKDLNFLRYVEQHAFDLVLNEESDNIITYDENKTARNMDAILDALPNYGSVLVVGDDDNNDRKEVFRISADKLNTIKSKFDCIIVDLSKTLINKKADSQAALILNITDYIKNGGVIFIPPSTYKYLPKDRLGTEVLLTSAGLTLEMPFNNLEGFVLASKR